jgi:hypothetical protein
MKSTYGLEKVLKMISLYVSTLLCTLQHIVIHAMQLSGVNSPNSCTESETYAHVGLRDGGPVFHAPPCSFNIAVCISVLTAYSNFIFFHLQKKLRYKSAFVFKY